MKNSLPNDPFLATEADVTASEPLASAAKALPPLWRRFASPSCLLLALVLFPLPWVEIQCTAKPSNSRARALMQAQQVPDWVADGLVGQEERTWLRQSGLQAALGSYTNLAPPDDPEHMNQFNAAMKRSSWMMALPLVLSGGAIAGFIRARSLRCAQKKAAGLVEILRLFSDITLLCALTALAILITQMVLGFPLEQALVQVVEKDIREGEDAGFRIKYTLWLGIALFAIAGAALLSIANHLRTSNEDQVAPAKAKKTGE
jgi:hypothetical protein